MKSLAEFTPAERAATILECAKAEVADAAKRGAVAVALTRSRIMSEAEFIRSLSYQAGTDETLQAGLRLAADMDELVNPKLVTLT